MNQHLKLASLSAVQPATLPLYIVIADFKNLGLSIVSEPEDTKQGVIANIRSGEWENVVRIIEVFEDEGTARNVTEDIAREVRDEIYNSREPLRYELKNWLHKVLGVTSTHGCVEAG